MGKIKFLMVLCIIGIVEITNAQQQVSETEARNAAINTLRNKTEILKVSSDERIKTVNSLSNANGDTIMYEVVFQNGAAVLLSGSKTCLPVLAYYTKPKHDNSSIFDANNENVPCCFRELLREYAQEIDSCFADNTITLYFASQWQELQDTVPNTKNRYGKIIVQPLLKTEWDQMQSDDGCCDAYNYYLTDAENHLQIDNPNKDFKLFPNPNPGTFQLETNFPLSDITHLKVVNTLGINVFETQNLATNTIRLQNAANGLFFVVVILKDGSVLTQKMMVQK